MIGLMPAMAFCNSGEFQIAKVGNFICNSVLFNYAINSYYYWLRKIRTAACSALPSINSENNIVPLEIGAISQEIPSYEINVHSKTTKAEIVLRLDSIEVEIHNNASASLIENTIRALRNAR